MCSGEDDPGLERLLAHVNNLSTASRLVEDFADAIVPSIQGSRARKAAGEALSRASRSLHTRCKDAAGVVVALITADVEGVMAKTWTREWYSNTIADDPQGYRDAYMVAFT
jgi:hypothetical protein